MKTPALMLVSAALLVRCGLAATVTTTADSGPGSLREAIDNAAPGETITFAVTGLITLTSGELLIDKNLIISGPGASNLAIQRSTVSGTPDFGIFNVASATVIISGLTVSNGRDAVGGGIYSQGNLTLNNCVVSGNFATERGGGIMNLNVITISDCVIRANSAVGETGDGFAGGFYNDGTATAINCTISNNSVTSGTGDGFAGGFYNVGAATAINCTISSNSVTSGTGGGYGGGIYNDGTLSLTSAVISDNSATGGPDSGGAIGGGLNNGFGTVYLNNSTVSGNVARGGTGSDGGRGGAGGVANGFGTVTLDRSTVSGNSAVGGDGGSGGPGEGGGVVNDSGTVYVFNSTVSGNVASGGSGTAGLGSPHGGGIFNGFGSLFLAHSTIAANVLPTGFLEDGGGLFNFEGVVLLKNSIVAANRAAVDVVNGEFGDIFSDGFNLAGSTSGTIAPGPGDRFNLTAAALRLGPLQNNGGPTFTHALLCGSPAIDAGDNTDAPLTDQRGFARIVGGVIDIGAFEFNNAAPTVLCPVSTNLVANSPTGIVATLSAQVADADGDPLVVVWTVDGTPYQTNAVAAGGPPTIAQVDFTAAFGVGSHLIAVLVSDPSECLVSCSTTVLVTPATVQGCNAVLELGAAKVSVTGPAGGILGDVGIGPNGSLAMSGDEFVTGTIRLGPGAQFSNSSHGTVQVAQNVDLSAEISAAYAKAVSAAGLPCTQSFPKLDGKSVTAISGVAGLNVICVENVNLSGRQITLFGPAGASFIINVTGNFVLTGGGQGPQIRVAGGVQPKDVLYNIIGSGPDVAFSGGGGGVNCCAAIVDGTLLAPQRKIRLSPGLVNGGVISGMDISIVSGSSVRCPASP